MPNLSFLDARVYCRGDGTLGHKDYRKAKPTRTDLYLLPSSFHHPAHKRSVLSTLRRVQERELKHLYGGFLNNGYRLRGVQGALTSCFHRGNTVKTDEEKRPVVLLFYGAVASKIGRVAGKFKLAQVYCPLNKLGQCL